MKIIKFRYAKFRKLVGIVAALCLVFIFYAWRYGQENILFNFLPFFLIAAVVIFLVLHGGYIFDRFRVDDTGLTIKRRLRRNLRFDFQDIERIEHNGGISTGNKEHVMTLYAGDGRKYRIVVSDVKHGDLLLNCLESGRSKARSIGKQ